MTPQLIDHFQNPRNVGELDMPAIVAEVSNPVCGDVLRLSIRVIGNHVSEVRYKVRGCAASIATGSAVTELIAGRETASLARLTRDDVENAVGGLSNESKHAAVLCIDGVRALVRQL